MLGSNVHAASPEIVEEYARLSANFDARQGEPALATDVQLKLANCILTGFETDQGAENIPQLMDLMQTLAQGVQFDDPVVVRFTAAHGDTYEDIVRRCEGVI